MPDLTSLWEPGAEIKLDVLQLVLQGNASVSLPEQAAAFLKKKESAL